LYRRILGEGFKLLPATLQQFHDQPGGGQACGSFEIQRVRGRIRNWLPSLLGLPRAGRAVPVRLQVVVDGERERWIREFGDSRMESVQWCRDGVLMEAAGPMRFELDVRADSNGMHLESRRVSLGPIPIPRFLAPRVTAIARGVREGTWHVSVQLTGP